ncbi:hypothetical protein P4S72_26560 [Vibrio sp. PP-XX7]
MEALGIKKGCFFSEGKIGTNAISVCMDTHMPSEVFAAEHPNATFIPMQRLQLRLSTPQPDAARHRLTDQKGTRLLKRKSGDHFILRKEIDLQVQIQNEQETMNRLQSAHHATLKYMDDGIVAWDEWKPDYHGQPSGGKIAACQSPCLTGPRDFFLRFASRQTY